MEQTEFVFWLEENDNVGIPVPVCSVAWAVESEFWEILGNEQVLEVFVDQMKAASPPSKVVSVEFGDVSVLDVDSWGVLENAC